MTIAAASAGIENKAAVADAVAGAQAHGPKGKNKTDFADVLESVLSNSAAQQQATLTQDSTPSQTAMAQVTGALHASTAANGDTTDDSADAISALAAKMTGIAKTNVAATNNAAATDTTLTGTNASRTPAKAAPATQRDDGNHGNGTHAALTAASQAKLVAALAQAATAHAQIVGSDGQTAASANADGTPATANAQPAQTQPAQTESSTALANVLAAMQTAQPVVTTIAPNASKTEATVTPRTVTQLEKAALGNTAQQALHASAPAAKTEALALNLPTDAKSANTQDGHGAQTGSDQKQQQNSDNAQLADAAKSSGAQSQPIPDAPQPATSNAPAVQAATNTAITNAASAIGNTATTQTGAPTTIATTLQIAQQTTASTTTPDLAALAVSIAAKSKDGQNEFNIRMNPAELGRVDVRLSVDAAGRAQAHLMADKPQTLTLLQQNSGSLERSLKDSGLDLSNNGLNFSLKGEQQSSTPTFIARNRALSINSVQTTDTVSSISSTSTAPGDSRLDIRV